MRIEVFFEELGLKPETEGAVSGLYAYMRNNDISDADSRSWVKRIVGVIRNEE